MYASYIESCEKESSFEESKNGEAVWTAGLHSHQNKAVMIKEASRERQVARGKKKESSRASKSAKSSNSRSSSSEREEDGERGRKKKQKKEKKEKEEEYDNGEMRFGLRLLDDLMNTFCDRLQRAAPHKIEGFMAIQFILAESRCNRRRWLRRVFRLDRKLRVDVTQVQSQISGKVPVVQIVYDSEREHYVVLRYDPTRHIVIIYDSLFEEERWAKSATLSTTQQVKAMFGHIFNGGSIPVSFDRQYDIQEDSWSCGYRAVACCVDLARGKPPGATKYNLQEIYDYLNMVISRKDVLPWKEFQNVILGEPFDRKTKREFLVEMTLTGEKWKPVKAMVGESEDGTAEQVKETTKKSSRERDRHTEHDELDRLTNNMEAVALSMEGTSRVSRRPERVAAVSAERERESPDEHDSCCSRKSRRSSSECSFVAPSPLVPRHERSRSSSSSSDSYYTTDSGRSNSCGRSRRY